MALTAEQVRWVAHLSRLDLSDAEVSIMTDQLDAILLYVNQLQSVPTEAVEPLAHPLSVQNVFRDDNLTASIPSTDALANAPDKQGDFFGVPAVLD